jgi:hypothetical protein
MRVLLGEGANDVIPTPLVVQLVDFPAVEAHLSPEQSHHADANVIGMGLLMQLKTIISGKVDFE